MTSLSHTQLHLVVFCQNKVSLSKEQHIKMMGAKLHSTADPQMIRARSIIMFTQNDQNLDPRPLIYICSILLTPLPFPVNFQNFTSIPLHHHHHHRPQVFFFLKVWISLSISFNKVNIFLLIRHDKFTINNIQSNISSFNISVILQ